MARPMLALTLAAVAALLAACCATAVMPARTPDVIVVLTALPSPTPTATPTPTRVPLTALRINIGGYPDIIDPQRSSFFNEIATLRMIYEGLTRLNEQLETVPGAADRWEYNADATVLSFHIRDGLTYSDGTPLNAKRFEYSLLRNIAPETAGEYASITDDIAGAAEWRAADYSADGYDAAQYRAAVGVKAMDASGRPCTNGADGYAQEYCRTLEITLKRPAPYFHTVMSMWVTYPAKEENILAGGDQWWNTAQYQTGNGPFVLDAVEPFVRQHFIPNPRYWHGQPTYDMEYRYITDGAVAFEAYRKGDFDIVGYAAEDLAQINTDETLKAEARLYAGSCSFGLMFNLTKEPFTDKRVREAFALAIDREAWVRDMLGGLGAPALTWIPPGYPGHDPDESRYAFDPEKARAALAESSYGGAEGLPALKWTFGDTPRGRTRAEWFQAQFETILGVTISLDPYTEGYVTLSARHDPATAPTAFILGWCADYPDPQDWLSVYWHTGDFGDRIGYSDPALDALLDRADITIDPAERLALYRQAEDLLLDDVPFAPLWYSVNACMVKPWVKGIVFAPYEPLCGSGDPLAIRIER